MDAIDELLKQVETLAPTPKLLPQLLAALEDTDADISRIVELITFDPALTAKLLQVCNSAYYAFPSRVSAVGEAVNRLGFHGVYMIVAVASSGEFLRGGEKTALDVQAMWRHLVTAAFAAQNLAKRAQVDAGLLFTAGLLHDLGKVPLAEVLHGDYDGMITDRSLFGRPLAELETASFGLNHAEVGARLLENWDFAPEFVAAVRWHHDSRSAGEHARLAACVELADLIAHSLEIPEDDAALPALDTAPALAVLGMEVGDLVRQRELVAEKSAMIDALCGAG
jgi:putative nucleotidyltransferase with HDIG domain